MQKTHVIAGIVVFVVALGCVEEQPGSRIINPNGDSELALLMREMYDDGMITKTQILEGKALNIGFDHRKIHTAEATEPEKVKNTEFLVMAKAYEAAVDGLIAADRRNRPEAYQMMVNTCAQCHSTYCPGPMVKIKKMYLSETQIEELKL